MILNKYFCNIVTSVALYSSSFISKFQRLAIVVVIFAEESQNLNSD